MKPNTQEQSVTGVKAETNAVQRQESGASVYQTKRAILQKLRGKLVVFDRPFDEDADGLHI
jgi:hypothetical protein